MQIPDREDKAKINQIFTQLRNGQQINVVYYGEREQELLQITGALMKVDTYWQILQINKVAIDFAEIYKIITFEE